MLTRLKGGGRGHRRLLLLIGREGGEDLVPLLPFILLVFAVLLRHCLLCDPSSPTTASALPREPPPQPSPSAAAAKAPKSLLALATSSAAVSSASSSAGALSRRYPLAPRLPARWCCHRPSRTTPPRPYLSDARRPGPLLRGSVVRCE